MRERLSAMVRCPSANHASKPDTADAMSRMGSGGHMKKLTELEHRIAWLEALVDEAYEGPVRGMLVGTEMKARPAPSNPPDQLAEEVGLLSLRGSGSYGESKKR